ncbi:hypothetical protein [Mycobacteroides abscessus]|uniref:hypothetical protein n=1 Tax=Mycobacteroides abscessus TaxID=36809 RepID=UPI0005E94236|nr:hypothetical protein [Mycobacteroides abscessus]PVB42503.1 hypothetical protein DDJ39_04930 [Mycobacteroides abscessus]CPR87439.1 Uncharacterised protein [Mycobacteroides abscessus]CPS57347.1 Uncharacterised protein [Mycobacteroides abscessus]CPY43356.1 Uncharacterised protein [Mycobacteroides abscessus]CPY45983.1 Uncharacterised protein [Mycobacteroides abscessus]
MLDRTVFHDLGDGWTVEMTWRGGEYQGGPASVWVHPTDDEELPFGGLSSTVLRKLDFQKAKADLLAAVAARPNGWRKRQPVDHDDFEFLRLLLAKGVTEDYLALLSSHYMRRVQDGKPKPVERLANELGRPLQTVRGHLWKARKAGLLEGSAGRKGGILTAEAMAILQRLERDKRLPPEAKVMTRADPPAGMEDSWDDR